MPVIAGFAILMLVLVMVPGIGVRVNGAQRWMDLGPMRLQVSEIGKLGLLFVMAHYWPPTVATWTICCASMSCPAGILAVFCGLIIIEPDFGTSSAGPWAAV